MLSMVQEKYKVILFYKFITIDDPEKFCADQRQLAQTLNLKGRIIIATEGINATLEGKEEDIDQYKQEIILDQRFADVVFKESQGNGRAFPKLAVKVRPEIVALNAGEFDVPKETAPTISADELESWYQSGEDFVILDLRNDYEIKSGYFERTVNPQLTNFRDLPERLSELEDLKNKKVVPVCTGGIRCEKATCLLRQNGFTNLYQLKDGIHTYMAKYPNRHFRGTLYVFDNRITTPVVDGSQREIVGHCEYCDQLTENYANDDSVRPSRKLLCCESCFAKEKSNLRNIVSV